MILIYQFGPHMLLQRMGLIYVFSVPHPNMHLLILQ
nr:MAG TPA: hypothetical protein [Caudoviricetes sp.]